jgi:hypothetical protein
MKRTLLFSLLALPLFLISAHRSVAQTAVYYCPQMGAVGYSYSDDETGHNLETIKKNALKQCQDLGGKGCTLLYATKKVGWGGFIRGKDASGNLLVFGVGHQLSDAFAKSELRRKYLAADGVELNDVLMVTWRAD